MFDERSWLFGATLQHRFGVESAQIKYLEVQLFRALHRAIMSLRDTFAIEEIHGHRSQVLFSSAAPWTKSRAQCELGDLCVIWYRQHPKPVARITFFQAKRSMDEHLPCPTWPKPSREDFGGDTSQWYLLHKRPRILGAHASFDPPPSLLKDALLPSIGSFGVFYGIGGSDARVRKVRRQANMFYASADIVTAPNVRKHGHTNLQTNAPAAIQQIGIWQEMKWACCLSMFGAGLYSGLVGTPIQHEANLSTDQSSYRADVRRWIGSFTASAFRSGTSGEVLRTFYNSFDIPMIDRPAPSPGASVVIIRGEDFNEEPWINLPYDE